MMGAIIAEEERRREAEQRQLREKARRRNAPRSKATEEQVERGRQAHLKAEEKIKALSEKPEQELRDAVDDGTINRVEYNAAMRLKSQNASPKGENMPTKRRSLPVRAARGLAKAERKASRSILYGASYDPSPESYIERMNEYLRRSNDELTELRERGQQGFDSEKEQERHDHEVAVVTEEIEAIEKAIANGREWREFADRKKAEAGEEFDAIVRAVERGKGKAKSVLSPKYKSMLTRFRSGRKRQGSRRQSKPKLKSAPGGAPSIKVVNRK